ncbi:MAG: discoidin domain-containing protein [Bacteroidaceae bacterium]|nr:discoidin domain-containing protein [Bacteroidaceae bacterium]
MTRRITFFLFSAVFLAVTPSVAQVTATRLNPTTVEVRLAAERLLTLDFYGPNIFRMFMDPQGGIVRDPVASPPAQILVDQPRRNVGELVLEEQGEAWVIRTSQVAITVNRSSGKMVFTDLRSGKNVTSTIAPATVPEGASEGPFTFDEKGHTTLLLSAQPDECFYGGGVQNGRYAHKGTVIAIENTNNWTDGGVASPTPFYWSTAGYGILWHTFRPGKYDFGSSDPQVVTLMHESSYLDLFMMIDEGCVPLLNDFYQLTGNPVLLPKFGFYEGHLNAYNRDYWVKVSVPDGSPQGSMGTSRGIFFEDGNAYGESQKPVDGGIRESLNGELEGNYQFSARAVIDRYEAANMPLGWVLPNDGYGAGYGQTSTLEGNVENLRQFGEYARSKGVEIGLWTQSDLHPKEGVEALLQRDIVREVRDAGVRVLKTDVAWVGAGYSFGLNGVADVGQIMPYYGNNARPFIISLDGWAGTQRYAGIWTGDQTGGEWEYIRFHIPTYIGSGLSGQPNISSDMDGIFGGRNVPVNVRDFQWKTFTPMQLNMDGWGSNPKYPQALGEPATSINRWYLKLKSMFMPYTYTIAREAIDGLPMIRPVVPLQSAAVGQQGNYEFLYGPSILVAPIYQNTAADEKGNDIRHNIYLPEGQWIDFFSGRCYEGGRIINHFDAPLWKLPLFVKRGAIIPMLHAHNNPSQIDPHSRAYLIIPWGRTEFVTYDDDGITEAYRNGESASTRVISDLDEKKGMLTVTVEPTAGRFDGFEPQQATEFVIDLQDRPKRVSLKAAGKKVSLTEAATIEDFKASKNVFFYDAQPQLNRWATPGSEMEQLQIQHAPRLYVCAADVDITTTSLQLTVEGYTFDAANHQLQQTGELQAPELLTDDFEDGVISPSAYEIPLKWTAVQNADYYEIEHAGQLYSTITANTFTIQDLKPETNYELRVRAVNKDGTSTWAREKFRTSPDPLRFAIHGITAEATIPDQPGQGIKHLFDFDESTTWHTAWNKPQSTPFDIVIDLHVITQIDKIQYVPRPDGGNGTITKCTVEYSLDKQKWVELKDSQAQPNSQFSILNCQFPEGATPIRYLRLHVEEARGGFGSGQQLYVFRVPDAEMMIPGDLNHDNRIDENDFTSYMNYTGLRQGDGDFEGYISRGDLNQNGLIDAYDISTVGIELESGVSSKRVPSVAGNISVTADKKQVSAGDIVTLTVHGTGLQSVNALSFAIPYDATLWEYVGIDAAGMKEMRNLTYDRLHTNGQKALYPTYVNCGEHPYLEGDADLLTIRFRAKQKGKVNLTPQDGMILDKYLNVINW